MPNKNQWTNQVKELHEEDYIMKGFFAADYWHNATPQSLQKDIDKGDVNARDEYGNTPLIIATWACDKIELIRKLIDNGADVNARNGNRTTALMMACIYTENADIVATLIDNGADVNAINRRGGTALIYACKYNKEPDIIATLFANGAYTSVEDEDGNTAWDWIQKNKHKKKTKDYKIIERHSK